MKGHCRFLRVEAGICHFAKVWLEIQSGSEHDEVVDALPDKVDPCAGEVNRATAPTWVEAALDGMRLTVAHARSAGLLTMACRVELRKLVGTVSDTREDAILCAAGLATWDALGVPGPVPEVVFDGQRWKLLFPFSLAGVEKGVPQ